MDLHYGFEPLILFNFMRESLKYLSILGLGVARGRFFEAPGTPRATPKAPSTPKGGRTPKNQAPRTPDAQDAAILGSIGLLKALLSIL